MEIIIIDDCSSDKTRDVIIALSQKDDRVKYFFQSTNQGAAIARNLGIEKAKGRYISFLDADDVWEPSKIALQLQAIEEGHPFVYCAYDLVNSDGKQIAGKCKIKHEITYEDELTRTYISTPTVIYDRKFFDDALMPLRRTGQDYAFWLLLLSKSNAYGIDEALVHVMRREGSLSRNKFQSLIDVYEVQTQLEKIGKFEAGWNTFMYLLFAIHKKLRSSFHNFIKFGIRRSFFMVF